MWDRARHRLGSDLLFRCDAIRDDRYNWDHQHVILRVVAWLQAHGYLVWVDTEQMKGSTVDAMALAVEGSEVMLIGVSRAYKESSNCRMEAQYGLQKKKVMIPLKVQEGYEADGWLGLLLGTSLWYALYGDTLESESAFEDRMAALSREIGSRVSQHPRSSRKSNGMWCSLCRSACPLRMAGAPTRSRSGGRSALTLMASCGVLSR
eukprot:COSAG04_NODE_135_length_23774_cov_40.993918_10_plen_206_part_00